MEPRCHPVAIPDDRESLAFAALAVLMDLQGMLLIRLSSIALCTCLMQSLVNLTAIKGTLSKHNCLRAVRAFKDLADPGCSDQSHLFTCLQQVIL